LILFDLLFIDGNLKNKINVVDRKNFRFVVLHGRISHGDKSHRCAEFFTVREGILLGNSFNSNYLYLFDIQIIIYKN